jgi:hypothetical protein
MMRVLELFLSSFLFKSGLDEEMVGVFESSLTIISGFNF